MITGFLYTIGACQDLHPKCSDYASHCTGYENVKKQCPLTCKQCGKLLVIVICFGFELFCLIVCDTKIAVGSMRSTSNANFEF